MTHKATHYRHSGQAKREPESSPLWTSEQVVIDTNFQGDRYETDTACHARSLLLLVQSPIGVLARPVKTDKAAKSQGVSFRQEAGKVEVRVEGQPFTTYYFEGYNKPVFFPLRAATGTIVTRGYPMIAGVPGEAQDHPHHKGLWFTHGDVNGVDFWSESDKTGKIVHRKFVAVKGGPKTGVLQSENDWVMPAGETVLKEIREVDDPQLVGCSRHGLRS